MALILGLDLASIRRPLHSKLPSDVIRRTDHGSLRDQYLRMVPFAVLDALELRLRRIHFAMWVIRMDLVDGYNGSFTERVFRRPGYPEEGTIAPDHG